MAPVNHSWSDVSRTAYRQPVYMGLMMMMNRKGNIKRISTMYKYYKGNIIFIFFIIQKFRTSHETIQIG